MSLAEHIELSAAALAFTQERHLASLTTIRKDGSPHVVPIGFTWDQQTATARIITDGGSVKVRNVYDTGYAALCQVERGRWLTIEGRAEVRTDPASVRDAEEHYAQRYRVPRVNPNRVVIVVHATGVLPKSARQQ